MKSMTKSLSLMLSLVLVFSIAMFLQGCAGDPKVPRVRPDGYVDFYVKTGPMYETYVLESDDCADVIFASVEDNCMKYWIMGESRIYLVSWAKDGTFSSSMSEYHDEDGNHCDLMYFLSGDDIIDISYANNEELSFIGYQSYAELVVTTDMVIEPVFEITEKRGVGFYVTDFAVVNINEIHEANGFDFWSGAEYAYFDIGEEEVMHSEGFVAAVNQDADERHMLDLLGSIKLSNYQVDRHSVVLYDIYIGDSGRLYLKKQNTSYNLEFFESGSLMINSVMKKGTVSKIMTTIQEYF